MAFINSATDTRMRMREEGMTPDDTFIINSLIVQWQQWYEQTSHRRVHGAVKPLVHGRNCASKLPTTIPLYIDNSEAITAITSESRGRNRHFDIRLKFMRKEISVQDFVLDYIPSAENPADGGTKALDRQAQLISARRLLGASPQILRN